MGGMVTRPKLDQSVKLTPDFVRHYGLTAQETRLVEALANGATPEEAAAEFDVSIATIRKHIQSIFIKTGVRRQIDLVRLALLHPSGSR